MSSNYKAPGLLESNRLEVNRQRGARRSAGGRSYGAALARLKHGVPSLLGSPASPACPPCCSPGGTPFLPRGREGMPQSKDGRQQLRQREKLLLQRGVSDRGCDRFPSGHPKSGRWGCPGGLPQRAGRAVPYPELGEPRGCALNASREGLSHLSAVIPSLCPTTGRDGEIIGELGGNVFVTPLTNEKMN